MVVPMPIEVEVVVDVAVDVLLFMERPQHTNVLSGLIPHALSSPALTMEKVPVGGFI